MPQSPIVALGARYTANPNGAGRFLDFIYPAPGNYTAGSVIGAYRNNTTNQNVNITSQGLGGGGGNNAGVVQGLPVCTLQSSGVAGNGNAVFFNPARVIVATAKNALPITGNDLAVWRIIFNVSLFAAPIASGEVGCYLATDQNQSQIVSTPSSGFGYRFQSTGAVDFVTITGVAPTNTNVIPALGSDVLVSLELQLFSATSNADASLRALVNGIVKPLPITSSSWAAGTLLPLMGAVTAGQPQGFLPCCTCKANNVNGLRIQQVRIMAGPTLASLY